MDVGNSTVVLLAVLVTTEEAWCSPALVVSVPTLLSVLPPATLAAVG
jgi:hypothetical protein